MVFLGYVVRWDGVSVDQTKIEAIRSWPTPTNISEVILFYDLASFYRMLSVTSISSCVQSQAI